MSDEHVRDDLRMMAQAANRLYSDLAADDRVRRLVTDDKLRRDIDHMVEAMQDAGKRVIQPRRRTNWRTVVIVGGATGAGLMAYPKTRNAIMRGVRSMSGRASGTVSEASERVGKATEAVSHRVEDLRDKKSTDASQAA
jgi:hypothetical protein